MTGLSPVEAALRTALASNVRLRAERDASLAENARLRAAVEGVEAVLAQEMTGHQYPAGATAAIRAVLAATEDQP